MLFRRNYGDTSYALDGTQNEAFRKTVDDPTSRYHRNFNFFRLRGFLHPYRGVRRSCTVSTKSIGGRRYG